MTGATPSGPTGPAGRRGPVPAPADVAGPARRELTEREMRLWRTFWTFRANMDAALESGLQRSAAISGSDFEVLNALSDAAPGPLRLRDLGLVLDWERSRVSHHLRRMEARGLVERHPSEGDRRGVTVTLAPAGAQVLAQAGPDRQALVVSLVFEALDDKDLDLLEGVFTTMLESIERHFPAR